MKQRQKIKLYDDGELAIWLASTPQRKWGLFIYYGGKLVEISVESMLEKISEKEEEADRELADTVFSNTD